MTYKNFDLLIWALRTAVFVAAIGFAALGGIGAARSNWIQFSVCMVMSLLFVVAFMATFHEAKEDE